MFYLTRMINGAVWVWPREVTLKGRFNRLKLFFHKSFQPNRVSLPFWFLEAKSRILDVGPKCLWGAPFNFGLNARDQSLLCSSRRDCWNSIQLLTLFSLKSLSVEPHKLKK